jgi:hypothetical protein
MEMHRPGRRPLKREHVLRLAGEGDYPWGSSLVNQRGGGGEESDMHLRHTVRYRSAGTTPPSGRHDLLQSDEGVVGPGGRCRGRNAERSLQCTVLCVDRTRSIVIIAGDVLAQNGHDSKHGQRQQAL